MIYWINFETVAGCRPIIWESDPELVSPEGLCTCCSRHVGCSFSREPRSCFFFIFQVSVQTSLLQKILPWLFQLTYSNSIALAFFFTPHGSSSLSFPCLKSPHFLWHINCIFLYLRGENLSSSFKEMTSVPGTGLANSGCSIMFVHWQINDNSLCTVADLTKSFIVSNHRLTSMGHPHTLLWINLCIDF